MQLPLVLLVAAGRAEGHDGHAVAQGDGRGEGGARAAAGRQRVRQALLQPGHLQPGAQREAEFGHDRVGLQPAAAGSGGDHVAPAVDHVEVAGVAAGGAVGADLRLARRRGGGRLGDGRLADAERVVGARFGGDPVRVGAQPRAAPAGATGPQLVGRLVPDERAPLCVVGLGQQVGQRHLGGVPVPGLAVGHGELAALDQQVDVVGGPVRRQLGRQQGELLQEHRALAPGPGLAHGPAVPVVRHRRLVGRGPAGEVVGGQCAGVVLTAGVQGGPPGLPDQRLGDEAAPPHLARRLDARLPVAGALRLGEQPLPGGGERGVAQQLAGARRPSAGQVDLRGGGPLGREQLPDGLDGLADALHRRVPVLGVADGVLQDLGERLGAVVAQQEHPGVEGAGDGGGQRPGARDEVQPQPPVVGGARPGRCHTLPAQHPHLAAGRGEQDGHLAGGTVQVRFDDVQHEGTGHGRVVGVAAVLQYGHRRLRGQPVGGGDHAEGALQGRSGGEHTALTSLFARVGDAHRPVRSARGTALGRQVPDRAGELDQCRTPFLLCPRPLPARLSIRCPPARRAGYRSARVSSRPGPTGPWTRPGAGATGP